MAPVISKSMKRRLALQKARPWESTIRRESGLVEHVCRHGVGHPAAASVHWLAIHDRPAMGTHGCDGCCATMEWILADASDGYKIANGLLKTSVQMNRVFCAEIQKLRTEKETKKRDNRPKSKRRKVRRNP
jgi:hypothetical protein